MNQYTLSNLNNGLHHARLRALIGLSESGWEKTYPKKFLRA